MAQRLTVQLCIQVLEAVKARITKIKPAIDKRKNEAEAQFRAGNIPAFDENVRKLVLFESEFDLLDLVAYSIKHLVRNSASFGPPSNLVPKEPEELSQSFGVVVFAADICTAVPELGTLRNAVFCHYGVNELHKPISLPGGGAGPGEGAKLHNIIVPKTLVELYNPRFKDPLAVTVQKRRDKLIASYGGAPAPAAAAPAAPQMRKTASPFPQIPAQQRQTASPFPQIPAQQQTTTRSPFPSVPTQQNASPFPSVPAQQTASPFPSVPAQQNASPFPQIPSENTARTGSVRRPSGGEPRTAGAGQHYHAQRAVPAEQPMKQTSAGMFPPAPTSTAFPPSPTKSAKPREDPPSPKGSRRQSVEPSAAAPTVDREPSPTEGHHSEHTPRGSGSGLFGIIKKAFSHKKEDSQRNVDQPPTPTQVASRPTSQLAAPSKPEPVGSAEPAAPTPENGDVVSLSSSDVEINPQTLAFGLSSRQAPVDSDLTQELTVKNKHKQTIIVLLEHVKDPSTDFKYNLTFSHPVSFALKGGAEEKLVATLQILCTTKLEIEISVKTWKEGGKKYKDARLSFATESQLTTKLDPDELKRDDVIGEGAFGSVYSGRYRGQDVAIKVLKYQDCMTPDMLNDFKSEVDMMEKLRHNAILGFIGAVHLPGHLSIVTELCPYGSFLSAMKKYPDDFNEALRVKTLLDASNGMDFLHQSGIIHRDLKPDNLLIVSLEPRSAVVAKLSDFGTTRDVNSYAASMQSTKGVGTPLFMAPEIFMCKPYDKSVDIYSYSLIIYVAFATAMPFEGDPCASTPWAFADAIKTGKRPGVPPSCPPEIADMMKKCWNNEPSKRPSFEDVHMFFRKYYKEHYPQ